MQKKYELSMKIINEVKKAITGKDECIAKVLAAIIAGGHILLEDVPGVGKTTMATAFSKAMSLENHRVSFTPDVMPADILGFNMYHKETGEFAYHPGAIMCNFFLADEINRTSPKTQSALLEVMEEGYISMDGYRYQLPKPFIVMATQNPKGSAGTQLLPESQLDRFMISMSIGYPDPKSEITIAMGKSRKNVTENIVNPIISAEQLIQISDCMEHIQVHTNIYNYIVKLSNATRDNEYIELGLSPRATIACVKMAKAWAFLNGRNYVIPSDVTDIFTDVAKHRIVLNTKARVTKISEKAVIEEIITKVKQPTTFTGRTKEGC